MIETNTLDFLRRFTSSKQFSLPLSPQVANYATVGAYGAGSFQFINNTYSQSVITYLALDQDLVTRYVDYEDMDDSPLCSCLTGDTMILTAEGEISIFDLAMRYKSGKKFPILAYDRKNKKFVGAWAHSPRKTKRDKVIKITFDNGSILKCTSDHKILNRKSEWVEAQTLQAGDRVMPGTIKKNKKRGYLFVVNPEQPKNYKHDRMVEIHRLFGRLYFGDNSFGMMIHHDDENKLNNSQSNLILTTRSEHAKMHIKDNLDLVRKSVKSKMTNKSEWANSQLNHKYEKNFGPKETRIDIDIDKALSIVRKNEFMRSAAKELGLNETTLCRRLLRAGIDYRKEVGTDFYNHKVVSVEQLGEEDVYDLTTDIYHNFVANGVVVHNSAIDIYSDDASQIDPGENKTIWVSSDDEFIRKELDVLLHKTLNIEEFVWSDLRGLCKYGNHYKEMVVKKNQGVIGLNPIPSPTMRRIEVGMGAESTTGFIYDPTATFRTTTADFISKMQARLQDGGQNYQDIYQNPTMDLVFEDWEILHFRLRGKNQYSQYGHGIFEPARWIYKRMVLLEDSLVLYRLQRAPSRYAFYIDVTNVPPQETNGYLNKIKQAVKKQKYVNNSNKRDQKFDVLSGSDDFFLPVRDGKESTRVESLAGPVYDAIEDVKFFENKLFAALKVPKPFLTYEESTAKTNLSAEDTRFARTIMRIQREYKNGIKKLCRVHLASKGIDPSRINFEVHMTIPSAIFELAQLEIKNAELELADKFGSYAPRGWIMKNILKFSDSQIEEMEKMRQLESGEEKVDTGGSSDGSIDRAVEKLHQKPEPTPEEEPLAVKASGESRGFKLSSDQYWNGGLKKDMSSLMERLEEAKHRDKEFSRRWNRATGLLEEIRGNLKR